MAKTKGNKKEGKVILTRENLLYQPLSLAASGYNATAFQQNIVIGVLRKLKHALMKAKDGQFQTPPVQLSLFDSEDASVYVKNSDEMRIAIHMRELGVEPNNYHRAFDEVEKLGKIMAWVPEKQPDGSTHLRMETVFGLELDSKDVITDEKGKVTGFKKTRTPVVYINLKKSVSDFIFNPQSRIYDFIDDTAMMIKDKYPKRLYMYLSNSKYMSDGLTIGYWKFRQHIGFDDSNPEKIMYPQFYDFKKKVLDASVEVLKMLAEKDLSDFWFEWEPIYKGSKRAKAPDELHFTFHLSGVGRSIKEDKGATPKARELEERLREDFDQTAAQIKTIILSLEPSEYDAINRKLDELKEHLDTTRTRIKDRRAYVNKILTDFINASDTETKNETSDKENETSESFFEETLEEVKYSAEDYERWQQALALLPSDWQEVFILQEVNESGVVVQVPSASTLKTFYHIIGKEKISEMEKTLKQKIIITYKG